VIAVGNLIGVVIACVIAQAYFVGTELALATCNRVRLRQRAESGDRAAKLADRLMGKPQVTLATTMLGANLAALLAVLSGALHLWGQGLAPLIAVAIIVPPLLVLGQVIPKALAQANADRVVVWLAPPLALLSWLLRPAVWVVGGFASAMTRLAGTETRKAFVTRDELSMLIESEPETDKPDISAEEREMIANVFELSEYRVRDLMVPLSEVTALPEDTALDEAAREIADKQHSRMPVYRSRVDDIVGIVHLFDVLQAGADRTATVAQVARPAVYVPETMKAIDLLVELQAEGNHLAVVVDEYGGAVGVVTVEDLLETIVGDIDDEYDDEPSPIRPERPGVWRVEARTSVARVNQELDLDLPESDDYETIAGLLIERFRHIPEPGEVVNIGAATIEVTAASDRAIELVRVTRRRK
jgi:CBS domain containing-hemolysin-like protein